MRVELTFPNRDNDGSDNSAKVMQAIQAVCSLYGGATVYRANGYWISPKGKLFTDDVSVVISYATRHDNVVETMRGIARTLLESSDQKAVLFAVDGKAEIVD
jgi:hypothetical protein